ncbi:MAG: T9SS type A sorting domain-containing protein [Saprospiraceae bacterium]|nr:T9SS type A sorting domain-containing protein [Saprospiraceae bacterium]
MYPNPLKDGMVLTMKYYSETSGTARYQIITMDGKVLNTNTTGMVEGTNTVQIEVNGLPAGAYLVKLIGNENKCLLRNLSKRNRL